MNYLLVALCIIVGYFCGCFLTATFVSKKYTGKDISEIGTGNPGMANVMARIGKKAGFIVLGGDILKTLVAFFICYLLVGINGLLDFSDIVLWAGLGALLGHNFPFYRKFKGGKGVTVTCTWLIILMPLWGIVCCVAGGLVTLLTGLLPVGAALIALLAIPFVYVLFGNYAAIVMVISFLIMTYRHFPGLIRSFKNTEAREFKKKRNVSSGILSILIVVFVLYCALINTITSAVLVPEFMEQLESFNTITNQSVNELVQTDEIKENRAWANENKSEWLETFDEEHRLEISMTSFDGYNLMAEEFLQDEPTDKWVLLIHGYTGWKEEMYIYACWYYNEGYNVIVPDLRAEGDSEGYYIGMGYLEQTDCIDWINLVTSQYPDARFIIHGQSMGAATALLMTGNEDLPDNVEKCVADCGYATAYRMFEEKCVSWLHLPAFPFVDSVCLCLRLNGGYNLYEAAPIKAVANSTTPTLFIHGTEDLMINVDNVYELYEAASCEKQLLIVEGAGHCQSVDKDPDTYFSTLRSFIE